MKKYLLIATSSLLLTICLVPLGMDELGGHPIKFSIVNIVYCCFTFYLLKSESDSNGRLKIIGAISLPVFLVFIPLHGLHFLETMYALPSSIAHISGIGAGIFLTYASAIKRAAFLTFFTVISLWITLSGYSFWANKAFYGTYTGAVDEQIPPFSLVTANGQTVPSSSMKGHYVVLDFWNTSCTVCFKKFPQLQQYHTRYKNNSKVKFFAVNIPLSRDRPGQAARVIKNDGYTFPVLLAANKSLTSLFKVDSYPTVIILDPSQRIIYRGLIDNIESPLRELAGYR